MMKNKLISQFTWILVLCALSFTTLFYVACSKDKTVTKEENTMKPNAISEEESMLAQSQQFGQTIYTHLRFNFLSHKAEEYVNPEIREKVMSEVKKVSEEMKNLTTEQRIDKNITDKKLTEKQAISFRSLLQTCKQLDDVSNFQQVEDLLNGFNKTLLDDKTMPNSEKQTILNASVSIKRIMDYFVNIAYQPQAQSGSNNNVQLRDFCYRGKKWSCISAVIIGELQIIAGLASGTYFVAAIALVNTISAISNVMSNAACDCSQTGATCYTLNGVSLFRTTGMDCSGNYVKFCAWGDGPSPSSFTWKIAEADQYGQPIIGTLQELPNTGDKCANFSPSTNLTKNFLLIVTTSGFPNCNTATMTKSFPFTWGDIVGDAGTVVIDGPTNIYVGSSPTYYANGSFLLNPKNTFNWQLTLNQNSYVLGQVVNGGGSNKSVSINWKTITCGEGSFTGPYYCYRVSVGGNAVNSCSGNQAWGSSQVAVTP